MAEISQNEGGGIHKKSLDFSLLIADSHLSKDERNTISEAYGSDKEVILTATKGQLKNFIIRDYGEANKQYLGGFEGIIKLQKVLKMEKVDGSFGPDTFKALIDYQDANGLEKDGIAGPETMKKMGIAMNENISSTPTRKSNSRGGITNNPTTNTPIASIETPRKDVGKILTSFDIRLKGIQTSLNDNKKYRDENTGFFNVLADDLVNLAGGESGKAIYERNHQRIKDQASETIKNLDSNLNGVPLSGTERNQYLKIRSELEKTLGHTLGEPNPFITIKNSVMDTPNTVVNAIKGTGGVIVGAVETTYGAIKGIFDLTIFATRYTSSFVGEYMGVNPDYKNKMDAEIGKIYNTVKGMDFTKEQVLAALSQGFDQIKGDPYAIGKLAGIVIGILLPMKGAGALNGIVRGRKVVAQTAENAAEAAIKLGKPAEIAAAKLTAKVATRQANLWKVGEFVLNGPAESAIGAGLSKSFRLASGAIRGGISAKNIKTVEKSIEDFGDAIKNEKNPEKLKYLQEAKESLEGERNRIAKQVKLKTDVPKNEGDAIKKGQESRIPSNPPKSFNVDGIENDEGFKKAYRKVAQYYHSDRNSHPDHETLFKELKDAFEKNDTERFAKVAKDPDGYLKNKEGVGKTVKNPTEILIDRLSDYEKVFSESYLRQLAKSNAQEFGLALVNQFHIRQIKELAKVDPVLALTKGEAYLKNPKKYLESAYASPYHSLDDDIKQFAYREYHGAYKAEGEALQKQYTDAYENFLKNNADIPKGSFEQVQKIMSNFDEVMQLLGNKASEITRNIEEIIDLFKGNIKNNLSEIRTRIDTLIESVRLNQNIGLDIKAKISRKLKEIKESFGMKEKNNSRIEPTIEPQNPTHSKKPETQETPEVKAPKQEKGLQAFNPDEIKYNDLSGDANKFFYDVNIPKPTSKITIDGIDFFLTGKMGGTSSRPYVLGYAMLNGKLEPRYFYFSQSGGNWHSAPGFDGRGVSKGEQWNPGGYEKGTVVGSQLNNALNRVQDIDGYEKLSPLWIEKVGKLSDVGSDFNPYTKSNRFQEFRERHIVEASSNMSIQDGNISPQDLENMHINPKIDLSFRSGFRDGPKLADHAQFGAIESKIGTTTYNGQPIEVVFAWAKDKPDLIWIENILLKDSPVDSFGIPRVVFNGGLLTAKPAEYTKQVPDFIKENGDKFYLMGNEYVDIRPFLQDNPLIVQFKNLTGMKKAA